MLVKLRQRKKKSHSFEMRGKGCKGIVKEGKDEQRRGKNKEKIHQMTQGILGRRQCTRFITFCTRLLSLSLTRYARQRCAKEGNIK